MRTVSFFLLVTVYESVALKNALSSLKKTARLSSFIDRLALSLPLSHISFSSKFLFILSALAWPVRVGRGIFWVSSAHVLIKSPGDAKGTRVRCYEDREKGKDWQN